MKIKRIVANVFIAMVTIASAMIAANACNSNGSNPVSNVPQNTVIMMNYAFHPATLTVTKGTTITWKNDDDFTHTSTSNTGDAFTWDTGDVPGGGSATTTFNTAGTFPYYCKIHVAMGMKGTIIVQ